MEGFLDSINVSVRKLNTLFGDRLTAARAAKLDNLNATVSSRASQATADSALSKANQIMAKWNHYDGIIDDISTKIDLLTARAPTSGSYEVLTTSGQSISVTGSGVIHSLVGINNFALKVDGVWILDFTPSGRTPLPNQELANGGIRFNGSFFLKLYAAPPGDKLTCYYTKGD